MSESSTAKTRKAIRKPLTPDEKLEMAKLYATGEYSTRDIAVRFDSNPSTVARAVRENGVELRPPGLDAIAKRNMKRNNALRRAQREREAEVRLAQEIAEARRQERVDRRADEIAAARPDVQAEETIQTTWTPHRVDPDPHTFSTNLAQLEELAATMGSFSTITPTGHLRWVRKGDTFFPETEQLVSSGDSALDEQVDRAAAAYVDEHRAELDRAHAYAKRQWDSGVAYGYDQATTAVLELIDRVLEDTIGIGAGGALQDLRRLLERGEHWYLQRRDPKPWNDAQKWGER